MLRDRAATLAFFLAGCLPYVLAFDIGPVVGALQEHLSYLLWGICLLAVPKPQRMAERMAPATLLLLITLLGLAVVSVLGTRANGAPERGLLSFAVLITAASVLHAGWRAAGALEPRCVRALMIGLVVAGVANGLISLLQVTAPTLADDRWIAAGFVPGRANGNLRQPNHLAALELMSLVSLWALASRPGSRRWMPALCVPIVGGIVLSASRLGLSSLLLLVAIALVVRTRSVDLRRAALYSAVASAGAWVIASTWAAGHGAELALNHRLGHESASSSRWPLWRATLDMISDNPWLGVGWGEFNRVWMLTPKHVPTVHSFSNAHNLPLQLAAEVGIPLAAWSCGVITAVLRSLARRWRSADSTDDGRTAFATLLIVLMFALYSLLEFPLWYARFLLPCCFFIGCASRSGAGWRLVDVDLRWIGGLVIASAALVHLDYRRVVPLASLKGQSADRIDALLAEGHRSLLYSGMAFRGTALHMHHDPIAIPAVRYATQDYLDTRLMQVWAEALQAAGDRPRAQYLSDRMTELGFDAKIRGCAAADVPSECLQSAAALTPASFR